MSRRHHLSALRAAAPVILPSMLLCDYGNLQREVGLREAGIGVLRLDAMVFRSDKYQPAVSRPASLARV